MRKLPKVRAKIRMFAFEYNLHNMEPSIPFKTQSFVSDHMKEIKLKTCIKEMVEQQVRDDNELLNQKNV
jgi:hypothetical protein